MVSSHRRNWTREELILAFNLYCRLPFGRLHRGNPGIIALARRIGRTPSSVAMKACNFASLDPMHRARGVKGLTGASERDRAIWLEFHRNWEKLAYESQWSLLENPAPQPGLAEDRAAYLPAGETEKTTAVRVRLVQGFFRESVLSSYRSQCAFCRIQPDQLLNASHIIPWRENVEKRADPTNGLSLCALHDRAFDRGLMTLDEDLRIVVAPELKRTKNPSPVHRAALIDIEGEPLHSPDRFAPDSAALEFHRTRIFGKNPPADLGDNQPSGLQ